MYVYKYIYNYIYVWVSINGDTPIAEWFVMGKPTKMDDLGVTVFQETSI